VAGVGGRVSDARRATPANHPAIESADSEGPDGRETTGVIAERPSAATRSAELSICLTEGPACDSVATCIPVKATKRPAARVAIQLSITAITSIICTASTRIHTQDRK